MYTWEEIVARVSIFDMIIASQNIAIYQNIEISPNPKDGVSIWRPFGAKMTNLVVVRSRVVKSKALM